MTETNTWKNRIVGYGEEDADQLLANDANWRIHPFFQQTALSEILEKIGWVQSVIVNKRTSEEWGADRFVETVVDGHLRVSLAISREEKVPVVYVDLSPSEESLTLATFDPLSSLAATDFSKLRELAKGLTIEPSGVQEMLSGLLSINNSGSRRSSNPKLKDVIKPIKVIYDTTGDGPIECKISTVRNNGVKTLFTGYGATRLLAFNDASGQIVRAMLEL